MTTLALLLVLLAAVLHATWNLISKRAGGSALGFVYVVGVTNLILYAPFVAAFWLWKHPLLSWTMLGWIAAGGVLKTGYALFMQRSYRTGDFSLVYPLARGTGVLLATLGAVALLGERPSLLAAAGGIIIVVSIFFLADGPRLFHERRAHVRTAVRLGGTAGCFIASYTVWDRHGVAGLAIPPLLYDAGTTLTGVVLLLPLGFRRRAEVADAWRHRWKSAAAVAGISSLAYILVLTALAFTPVSYLAPAREVSIVFGAFLGAKYLKEADGRRRFWATVAIAAGIIALAVG
jgi:drug/metabolite transporter (DMT)-like permease